jgi:hypothetical protein
VIAPNELIELGIIYPNNGLLSSIVHLFCAPVDTHEKFFSVAEEDEVAEFKWFSAEQVINWITTGELSDSFTLCTLFHAVCRGLVRKGEQPH